tara:strand:- start:1486 stop:2211 length:726 start_codon:yes stop_codon:yes gene_type:complete
MPIPDSGAINMSDIRTVFGGTQPDGLGEYYKGAGIVPTNATTVNVPTSGPLSFSNFRSSGGTSNRSIKFSMRYDPTASFSGVGLAASDSVTGTPYAYSGNTSNNVRYYQPVFRAGTGFITTLSFGVGQNEDVSALTDNVVLYGGTDSSTVTDEVLKFRCIYHGSLGNTLYWRINWNTNGSISNVSYTGAAYPNNPSVVSLYYQNINSNHRWYRFSAKSPVSIGKQGFMINLLSLNNVPQPT